MQKDRPQFVKVRSRTATERAPSLGAAVRIAFTTADGRIVRLWPCATQAMHPRLQGVQSVSYPRFHSHGGSWLAPWNSRYGRACVASRTVWAVVLVGCGRCWPPSRPLRWRIRDC